MKTVVDLENSRVTPQTRVQSQRVSEVMTKRVIQAIGPHATVAEAVKKMKDFEMGCLLVVDGARPVGILTEWDLVHKVLTRDLSPWAVEVSQIMTKDLVTVGPEDSVTQAAKVMRRNGKKRLVVVHGEHVVGVLTATDLARLLAN